jgi:ribonuclease BN (tRNA processing enzyme)
MPNTTSFLTALFDKKGAYPYMRAAITGGDRYTFALTPYGIDADIDNITIKTYTQQEIRIDTIAVNHGDIPAIAYKVTIDKKSILFSGDTSAKTDNLLRLAKDADLFVANHAISHRHNKYAGILHMPPLRIGEISQKAHVKKLLLSHRMNRTLGKERESLFKIRQFYKGNVLLAEDHMKIHL